MMENYDSKGKVPYIMSLKSFRMLSNVRGFADINGSTYREHIIMLLNESSELSDSINVPTRYKLIGLLGEVVDDENVLEVFKMSEVAYTHEIIFKVEK